jgi:hypothetical protein
MLLFQGDRSSDARRENLASRRSCHQPPRGVPARWTVVRVRDTPHEAEFSERDGEPDQRGDRHPVGRVARVTSRRVRRAFPGNHGSLGGGASDAGGAGTDAVMSMSDCLVPLMGEDRSIVQDAA